VATTTDRLDDAAILALADRYRIRPDARTARGPVGSRRSDETGASVEIQDFRDYAPGDDPRRIDWRAWGRTGRLVVRLFRDEVSPCFDILVDTTASMALDDGRKADLVAELAAWLVHSARTEGLPVRLFAAGEQIARRTGPDELRFDAASSLLFTAPRRAAAHLRRAAVRLWLTDFMADADPGAVVRALSQGCSGFVLVHVLGPWEADPQPEGPMQLSDAETGRILHVPLDAAAIRTYRRRLEALLAVVRDEMARCGGLYIPLIADRGLEATLREEFVPLGLVETR
jgi:uncharacterized protein (DUF58 family)